MTATNERLRDKELCSPEAATAAAVRVPEMVHAMSQAGVTEPVTVRDVKRWLADPDEAPEWFNAARVVADDRRLGVRDRPPELSRDSDYLQWRRAKAQEEKRQLRQEERERGERERAPYYEICPKEAYNRLSIGGGVKQVVEMMRDAGVDGPLDPDVARSWVKHPEAAPDWLIEHAPMAAKTSQPGGRPTPNWAQKERIRREYTATFARDMEAVADPLDELRRIGAEHADQIASSDQQPGPFVKYLREWTRQHPETDQEQSDRVTANYLRHEIVTYDQRRDAILAKWWMPDEFFTSIWTAAMDAILDRFPELESAKRRGLQVRKAYDRRKQKARSARYHFDDVSDYSDVAADLDWGHPGGYRSQWPTAQEQREQRAAQSRENADLISSGRFPIGQVVRTTRSDGIGIVEKHNRVTVRVRYAGPEGTDSSYWRTEKPYFLTPITAPDMPNTGDQVKVNPCGDGRGRDATVLDVDGPFTHVTYRLASGEERQRWVDPTRIVTGRP